MSVEFPCKERGCKLTVSFDRNTTLGGLGALFRKTKRPPRGETIAVYLPCGDGHVHRYEVPATDGPH
jgi:hypothetical protein